MFEKVTLTKRGSEDLHPIEQVARRQLTLGYVIDKGTSPAGVGAYVTGRPLKVSQKINWSRLETLSRAR